MKIGSKGKNPKQKSTTIQEPSQPVTNSSTIAAISKEEEGEKSKNNHKEQDECIKNFDQNRVILDPQVPSKYKESDDLQRENSDKSSDTTILADVHVSE